MTVNYIYNSKGKPEYAVVPYFLWETIEKQFEKEKGKKIEKISEKFNPVEFKGILKHLNLDLDNEIKELRKQWARNIS